MISRVFFLLGGVLLLGADCQEDFKDPRTIEPWTLVYTVQPYYQSEALVNFWKSEKNVKIPGEFFTWPSMSNQVLDKPSVNDTVTSNQINSNQHQHDSTPQHPEKKVMSEITYWPPRKSNDQRPPFVIPRYFDSV
ncbi:hypothetical protein KQX54_001012 [Cotesia glomerata]|uniref:Uncharacterized protein n=1 Tax=Cotesia glomerata TaxID=32391 RepID=A0AAV7ISS6_COTGL|nr:hypothetical protein KQX54_001012 [Cotesia glomerata]